VTALSVGRRSLPGLLFRLRWFSWGVLHFLRFCFGGFFVRVLHAGRVIDVGPVLLDVVEEGSKPVVVRYQQPVEQRDFAHERVLRLEVEALQAIHVQPGFAQIARVQPDRAGNDFLATPLGQATVVKPL